MERLALVDAQSRRPRAGVAATGRRQIEPGTEIVLVSTRPIDLSQADYAGKLPGDVARRLAGHAVRVIDTSNADLARFFQPE